MLIVDFKSYQKRDKQFVKSQSRQYVKQKPVIIKPRKQQKQINRLYKTYKLYDYASLKPYQIKPHETAYDEVKRGVVTDCKSSQVHAWKPSKLKYNPKIQKYIMSNGAPTNLKFKQTTHYKRFK